MDITSSFARSSTVVLLQCSIDMIYRLTLFDLQFLTKALLVASNETLSDAPSMSRKVPRAMPLLRMAISSFLTSFCMAAVVEQPRLKPNCFLLSLSQNFRSASMCHSIILSINLRRTDDSQIYTLKLDLLKHQFPDRSWHKKQNLVKMSFLILLVYLESWFRSSSFFTAAADDIQLHQRLQKFSRYHNKLSQVWLTVLQHHTWCLIQEPAPLSLFKDNITHNLKNKLAEKISLLPLDSLRRSPSYHLTITQSRNPQCPRHLQSQLCQTMLDHNRPSCSPS